MGPELEIKRRSASVNTMEPPDCKDNEVVVEEVENKHQNCVSNYEDFTFELDAPLVGQSEEAHMKRGGDADIMDVAQPECNDLVEEKGEETTECSSSFDDVSGGERSAALSDAEVVSEYHEDATFDKYGQVLRMRKKRLTSHWRTFIQPLMWRCKWAELQIKMLNEQAQKFDKELAEYSKKKQFQVENLTADFCAREVPYLGGSKREVLKRKRRKRIGDSVDVTAYMSQHNLFSYHENRKAPADGVPLGDEFGKFEKVNFSDEFKLDGETSWLESKDIDESLEQVLRKIGALKGQVNLLKTRLDKVMSANAGKFSYADNQGLLVPSNALMSSARDPASPPNNGDRMAVGSSYIASQLLSQYNFGDVVLPESAVSSHGEVKHLADIIESSNQPYLGGTSHVEDGILIYNDRMNDGMNNFDEIKIQPPERPQATVLEYQGNTDTVPPVLVEPEMLTDDQPAPKIRSIAQLIAPKNRKSQGKRRRRRS